MPYDRGIDKTTVLFGVTSFPCAVLGTEIFLHSKKKVVTLDEFKG